MGRGREWKPRTGRNRNRKGKEGKGKPVPPRSFCPSEFRKSLTGSLNHSSFLSSLYLSLLSCTHFQLNSPAQGFTLGTRMNNHNSKTQAPSRWWKMAALFLFISSLWTKYSSSMFSFHLLHSEKWLREERGVSISHL